MLANLHAIDRSGLIGYIIVNVCGFPLQFGDVAFIRGDTVSSGHQITLICFSSNRGIQIIYVFHQSAGSITNLAFKSCYFPLYATYASFQCCNRSHVRFICHICRHSILDFSFPGSSQIAQVSIRFAVQCRCNCGFISFATHSSCKSSQLAIQIVDVRCIRSNIGRIGFQSQFSICLRLGIDLICRINFF